MVLKTRIRPWLMFLFPNALDSLHKWRLLAVVCGSGAGISERFLPATGCNRLEFAIKGYEFLLVGYHPTGTDLPSFESVWSITKQRRPGKKMQTQESPVACHHQTLWTIRIEQKYKMSGWLVEILFSLIVDCTLALCDLFPEVTLCCSAEYTGLNGCGTFCFQLSPGIPGSASELISFVFSCITRVYNFLDDFVLTPCGRLNTIPHNETVDQPHSPNSTELKNKINNSNCESGCGVLLIVNQSWSHESRFGNQLNNRRGLWRSASYFQFKIGSPD